MISWYRAEALSLPRRTGRMRIECPALLLWGVRDRAVGMGAARGTRRLCADARFVPIAGAGHFVQHERPEEVNRALLEHLGAPRASGA
jgi:pimeloyl-ACP methyl ester carboxylesterase